MVNGGYQSIHSLQLATVGESFGNELRARRPGRPAPDGPLLEVDYEANARSLGCATWRATGVEELAAALAEARAQPRPALIACSVEPRRAALPSGAWWDLGLPSPEGGAEWRYLG
jgi:3D-(3,5/4)-trihydroxycyclohexane-1,2-dione acylhydrolase (decyclizing)